jgi:excisionase family DNA binding protein
MSAQLLGRRLWLSVPEYSARTGVPEQTVRRQLREGKLHARKVGNGRGHWQVLAREAKGVNNGTV